jgi:hypothetical protein
MNLSKIILYEDALKLASLFFAILSFSLIVLGIINKKGCVDKNTHPFFILSL